MVRRLLWYTLPLLALDAGAGNIPFLHLQRRVAGRIVPVRRIVEILSAAGGGSADWCALADCPVIVISLDLLCLTLPQPQTRNVFAGFAWRR